MAYDPTFFSFEGSGRALAKIQVKDIYRHIYNFQNDAILNDTIIRTVTG